MNYPAPDDSRRQAVWYEDLGPAEDLAAHGQHITEADLANTADAALRRRLRRQRVIGAVISFVVVALIAAYLIIQILGR